MLPDVLLVSNCPTYLDEQPIISATCSWVYPFASLAFCNFEPTLIS